MKNPTVVKTFRIPEALYEEIASAATSHNISINRLWNTCAQNYVYYLKHNDYLSHPHIYWRDDIETIIDQYYYFYDLPDISLAIKSFLSSEFQKSITVDPAGVKMMLWQKFIERSVETEGGTELTKISAALSDMSKAIMDTYLYSVIRNGIAKEIKSSSGKISYLLPPSIDTYTFKILRKKYPYKMFIRLTNASILEQLWILFFYYDAVIL